MDSRLSAIVLIPWDPDSLEHVNRMKQQRIACGWKEEAVESWRESQAVGKTGLHWIVSINRTLPLLGLSDCKGFRERYGDPKHVFCMHVSVLPPSHPETTPRLQKHVRAYPDEDTPLQDTSRLVLSRSRTPDTALVHFVPIGHISLDAWAPDPELDTSASSGVYSITTFYISRALQKTGLGVTALSSCESHE
ncbi:hypothetical protein BJ170DRAFT_399382 [Xylariales sp. AK1849]|nr:hypothetical protein BJ170DRAFT_399382 [Xylariales sp. AK1849]